MSRKSMLAITAVAMLGTTSLIPVDATARGYTRTAATAPVRSAAVSRSVAVAHAPVLRPVTMARPTVTSTSHIGGTAGLSHNSVTTAAGGLGNARIANTPNNSFTLARGSARADAVATPSTAKQITDLMNKANTDRTNANNIIGLAKNINAGADAAAAEAQRQRNIAAASAVLANKNPGNAKDELKSGLQASLKAVELDKKAADLRADAAERLKAVPGLLRIANVDTRIANRLANGSGTDGGATGTGNGTPGTGNGTTGAGNGTPGGPVITVPPLNGQVAFPTNPSGIGGGGFPRPNINGSAVQMPRGPMMASTTSSSPAQQLAGPSQVATSQQASSQAPSGCLAKKYLQSGFVIFSDLCTQEQAVNTTTNMQVASNANCLRKENPQSGGVLFKDVCTGEWATNSGAR